MNTITLTAFIFLLTVWFADAQSRAITNQNPDSAIKATAIRNGKSSFIRYTLNGNTLSRSDLDAHLMSYNQSAFELGKYKSERKSNLRAGLILASVSVAAIVAAGIQANHQGNRTGSLFSRAPIFCSINIAGLIGEIYTLGRRNDHLTNAIRAYNSRY